MQKLSLMRALALLPFLVLGQPALAQEVEQGTGVICDTADQQESFLALVLKGTKGDEAIDQVNKVAGAEHACGLAAVAFYRGAVVKTVSGPNGTFDIVKIVVVAGFVEGRWIPSQPSVQYTSFKQAGFGI